MDIQNMLNFWNKTIKEVKEKNERNLLKKLGVTGVGIGMKNGNGKESIIVLVDKKKPLEEISEQDLVPTTIDGKLTDVVEVGEIGSAVNVGDSAIHEKGGACTLGAICYRGEQAYYLQNAHCGGNAGDSFVSPSPLDGKSKKIGTITEKYFTKKVDALLAKADQSHTETTNVSQGNLNDYVSFKGRTSGDQSGRIIATNVTMNSRQADGTLHLFTNQIMFKGKVRGGDSGSGLYKKSGICGLVHSSNFDDKGFANHIDDVIDVTGVTFSPTLELRYFQRHEFDNYDKMDKGMLQALDELRHRRGKATVLNSDWRPTGSHSTGYDIDIRVSGGKVFTLMSKYYSKGKGEFAWDMFWALRPVFEKYFPNDEQYKVACIAKDVGFTRIGLYDKHMHIGMAPNYPQDVLWTGKSS